MDAKSMAILSLVISGALLFIAVMNNIEAKKLREELALKNAHKCTCSGTSTTTTNNATSGMTMA